MTMNKPEFMNITIPDKKYYNREEIGGKRIVGQFLYYQRALKCIKNLNSLDIKPYLTKISRRNGLFYVLEDSDKACDTKSQETLEYIALLGKSDKTQENWNFIKNFESKTQDFCQGNLRNNRPKTKIQGFNKLCKQCNNFSNGCKLKNYPDFSICMRFKIKDVKK